MCVREAGGLRGLAGVLILGLAACGGGPEVEIPVMPPEHAGPAELRKALAALEGREDAEGLQACALICGRLRDCGVPDSAELLSRSDEANLSILAQPGGPELKRAAAARLALAFCERAERPEMSRLNYPGPLGLPLRRLVLLLAASAFAEYGCPTRLGEILDRTMEAAGAVASEAGMTEDARAHFRGEARELLRKAAAARKSIPVDPTSDTRKFCESSVQDHLDEGTRQADFGTRDKADRSKMVQVATWYVQALVHFAVVRETRLVLSPAEESALGRQDLVLRSLTDLLGVR